MHVSQEAFPGGNKVRAEGRTTKALGCPYFGVFCHSLVHLLKLSGGS